MIFKICLQILIFKAPLVIELKAQKELHLWDM